VGSSVVHASQASTLGEILERVLDKGVVVAGDIMISLAGVELLTIKIRLLIASVDKAMEIGINWWQSDPELSSKARTLENENRELLARLQRLEQKIQA